MTSGVGVLGRPLLNPPAAAPVVPVIPPLLNPPPVLPVEPPVVPPVLKAVELLPDVLDPPVLKLELPGGAVLPGAAIVGLAAAPPVVPPDSLGLVPSPALTEPLPGVGEAVGVALFAGVP